MIEAGIQQRLVADSSISTLISTRVFPIILPDDPIVPAVTYQRISTVRDYTTTGPIALFRIRLQIDCWANTYAAAKEIDRAIRACLESFTGTLPDSTYISEIQIDSSQDLYESDARYYRVSTDYIIYAVE